MAMLGQDSSRILPDSGSSLTTASEQQRNQAAAAAITPSINCFNPAQSDFTIIWQNLTYRVDSRRWYTKAKERLFCSAASQPDDEMDAGSRSSSSPEAPRSKERIVLNRVCGDAKSRQVTAILGPSGAGKSSLLHCLFQNRTIGTSGNILVESRSRNKLKVCFIPQKDYLNEWLTVREDLMFVSRLKSARISGLFAQPKGETSLSSPTLQSSLAQADGTNSKESNESYVKQQDGSEECSTSLIDHEANALRVAELLGLNNCLDVKIKNISGGQKKRLSIARELMSKPDILILDEPTTGLDSLTCYKTVMVLRDLAQHSPTPMAIVVTIHQPEKAVFNLFDKTYFLSSKGVIYDDNPRSVVDTLESVAQAKLPVPNYNPASFLIELASDESQSSIVDKLSTHQRVKFSEKYELTNRIKRLVRPKSSHNGDKGDRNWKFCAVNDQDKYSSRSNTSSFLDHTRSPQKMPLSSISQFSFDRNAPTPSSPAHTPQPVVTVTPDPTTTFMTSATGDLNTATDVKVPVGGSISGAGTSLVGSDLNNLPVRRNSSGAAAEATDQYFISHQLRNCRSSQSNNLLQSYRHVLILTHRSWLSVVRNPTFTRSRLVFHTMLPLAMLAVFGNQMGQPNNCPKLDAEINIREMKNDINEGLISKNLEETRLGAENVSFFFMLMYGFGINIISCTASFYPLTMHMFKKEMVNGLYTSAPYFIGQMLAELPLEIIFPSISILLAYPLSGQLSSFMEWRMLAVVYVVFLVSYAIHSLGLLCGSISINNVSAAVLLGQILLLPAVMLSGFLIRPKRMSELMRKLAYGSIFRHGLSAFVAARYGFNICDCDEDMIPEPGQPIAINGLTPSVKHVIDYMFPGSGNRNGTELVPGGANSTVGGLVGDNGDDDIRVTEVFEKLSQQFAKSQTFAFDVKSCDDVKPFLMRVFDVEDSDLFVGIFWLILIIFVFKVTTFSIMKSFPYRVD